MFDAKSSYEHLPSCGPLLGLFGSGTPSHTERTISFRDRQLLVVVTDGITDARAPTKCREFFWTTGVVRAVVRAWRQEGDIAAAIHKAAMMQMDDASVMVLYRE